MMIAALLYLQTHLSDIPIWSQMSASFAKATTIEMRLDRKIDNGPEERCTLTLLAPSKLNLEVGKKQRWIWNGSSGIYLDLEQRTYRKLSRRPYWAWLSLVPRQELTDINPAVTEGKLRSAVFNGVQCTRVAFDPPKYISDMEAYAWYVDPASHSLLGWEGEFYNGVSRRWIGKVWAWVVATKFDAPDFHMSLEVTPPQGYREETAKVSRR